jgi:hypothetical protein
MLGELAQGASDGGAMSRRARKGDDFGSPEPLKRGRDARVEQLARERIPGAAVPWVCAAGMLALLVWRVVAA